jgi:hypothetical protein
MVVDFEAQKPEFRNEFRRSTIKNAGNRSRLWSNNK